MKMAKEADYNYLFGVFDESIIKSRYDNMEERAEAFIKKSNLEGKVILNHEILNAVMIDYFADIARLKDFEGIEHTNKNKITAFMAYWWVRRKPLQIVGDEMGTERLVYINEEFATSFIAKDFLFGNVNNMMESKDYEKCIEHIFYHLKYRVYTAQTIELMLMGIDTGIKIGRNTKKTS